MSFVTPKRIEKKKSTLELFQDADRSLEKTVKIFLNFINSKPDLSKEKRQALVVSLLAPQWFRKTTYNKMRLALIRICWEKMYQNPSQNIAVRQSINDLSKFSFYTQKNSDIEKLSRLGKIIQLISENNLKDPTQALLSLNQSPWGKKKIISLFKSTIKTH